MEHAEEIVQAFRDALHPSQPIQSRLKAAVEWLKIEQQGVAWNIEAKDDLSLATEDELVNFVMGYLTSDRRVQSVEMKLRERSSSPAAGVIEVEARSGHEDEG